VLLSAGALSGSFMPRQRRTGSTAASRASGLAMLAGAVRARRRFAPPPRPLARTAARARRRPPRCGQVYMP
jgi:hypothetical protein